MSLRLNLARFWAQVQLVQFAFDFVGVADRDDDHRFEMEVLVGDTLDSQWTYRGNLCQCFVEVMKV
jgi:hypothetical protein